MNFPTSLGRQVVNEIQIGHGPGLMTSTCSLGILDSRFETEKIEYEYKNGGLAVIQTKTAPYYSKSVESTVLRPERAQIHTVTYERIELNGIVAVRHR